jgi:hypothetical protein
MSACVLPACLSLPACVLVGYVLPACVLPVCILPAYLSCLPVSYLSVCHACLSAKDYAEYSTNLIVFFPPLRLYIYHRYLPVVSLAACASCLLAGLSTLYTCPTVIAFLSAVTCPDYLLRSGFVRVFELLYISLSSDILYDVHILCLLSLF